MTAPVLRKIIPGATPGADNMFIMHFMVPHNMQASAPAPTDPQVYLTTLPPMKVYVK